MACVSLFCLVNSKSTISTRHFERTPMNPSNSFNRFSKCLSPIFSSIARRLNDSTTRSNGIGVSRACNRWIRVPCSFIHSEKETTEKYLRRIEEDQERDIRQLEEKVREEVSLDTSSLLHPHRSSHWAGTSQIRPGT